MRMTAWYEWWPVASRRREERVHETAPKSDPAAVPSYNAAMNVELTPDQREFVRIAIESGRISREEEAIEQALALWERRERRRLEIIAMIDEADASLTRGEGIPITERSMKTLAEDVKQEGRRRSAAERRTASR